MSKNHEFWRGNSNVPRLTQDHFHTLLEQNERVSMLFRLLFALISPQILHKLFWGLILRASFGRSPSVSGRDFREKSLFLQNHFCVFGDGLESPPVAFGKKLACFDAISVRFGLDFGADSS